MILVIALYGFKAQKDVQISKFMLSPKIILLFWRGAPNAAMPT